MAPPLLIQIAIVNWQSVRTLLKRATILIFLGTKVHCKRTPRPLVGPSFSKCTWTLLTFVFEFELCTSRASIGPGFTLRKCLTLTPTVTSPCRTSYAVALCHSCTVSSLTPSTLPFLQVISSFNPFNTFIFADGITFTFNPFVF